MQIEFRGNDGLNQIAEDAFDFESGSNEKSKSNRFCETSDSDSSSSSYSSSSYSEDSLSTTSSDSDSSSSYSSTADSSTENVQQSNRFSALELSDSLSIPTRSTTNRLSPQANGTPSDTHMPARLYIQMEYYKNGTLDDLIQSGKVSLIWLWNES